jgi:GTP-binding protein EngB required for normal cell division
VNEDATRKQARQRESAAAKEQELAAAKERELAAKERELAAAKEREVVAAREREVAAARAREVAAARERESAAAREQELAAAKQREEAAASAMQQAQAAAAEARKQEAAAKSRADAAMAEAQKANDALQQGIRPVVMPTEEQYQATMKRIQYNAEKLHFAVCGTSGSGKSTLINAFRGLKKCDKNAAAVGVTETTSQITRYPDPRPQLPYSRFVWYDIPGAGTTTISDWQYFNDQGLFVFDFIVMVYDVRFTKIDVSIIENCYRFNIPVFIVRSKADQHIDNMMKELELDCLPGSEEYQRVYQDVKTTYAKETKADFERHIKNMAGNPAFDARDRQMLLGQRVYMVSAINVRSLVLKGSRVDSSRLIDEVLLVEDLLSTAARRRYFEEEYKGLFKRGREAITGAFSSVLKSPGPPPPYQPPPPSSSSSSYLMPGRTWTWN